MKIAELKQYDSINTVTGKTAADDGAGTVRTYAEGDVIEGVITALSGAGNDGGKGSITVTLPDREINLSGDAIRNTYVGDRRRFRVVENTPDRLVLKDLGSVSDAGTVRSVISARADIGLAALVDDFSETMGDKEKEDGDAIERLSDEDYSKLRHEGFSMEDFNAQRLVKAIERVKSGLEAARLETMHKVAQLRSERRDIEDRAKKSLAGSDARRRMIADTLEQADLPVTEANIAAIAEALNIAGNIAGTTENSNAFILKNEYEPTIANVYKSLYAGLLRQNPIDDGAWSELEPDALEIIGEANELLVGAYLQDGGEKSPADAGIELATDADAKTLLAYDIPLTAENAALKKELEAVSFDSEKTAKACAAAMRRGKRAADGLLADREAEKADRQNGRAFFARERLAEYARAMEEGDIRIEDVELRMKLTEIILKMTPENTLKLAQAGIIPDISALDETLEALRGIREDYYRALAEEVGNGSKGTAAAADEAGAVMSIDDAVELAIRTENAADRIASSPVTLYGAVFSSRNTITFEELADEGERQYRRAFADNAYELSATQIRGDLGDSIQKAFGNIASLLEGEGLEITAANERAVKILARSGMELSAENIEGIKYFDAKLTGIIDEMQPAAVMSLIRRGFNPLNATLDELKNELDALRAEEGYSPEEQFSTFLIDLERRREISDGEREAYIGIYRLLYQVQKNDGAAIGAVLNAGMEPTLKNLLTQVRTGRGRGVDAIIDDGRNLTVGSYYVNSISDQIEKAFTPERLTYERTMARRITEETDASVWQAALENENAELLSLEQLSEKLVSADKNSEGFAEAAQRMRVTMPGSGNRAKFLKAFDIADSAANIDALRREDVFDAGSADSLVEAVENGTLEELAAEELAAEKERVSSEFETISGSSGAVELLRQLDRYELLGQLAGRESYSFNVSGDRPAKINFTVVRRGADRGSICMRVSTEEYRLFAQLKAEGTEAVSGSISCDSAEELETAMARSENLAAALGELGIESGRTKISYGIDLMTEERYLRRLTELKEGVRTEDAEAGGAKDVHADMLYRIAGAVLKAFLQ